MKYYSNQSTNALTTPQANFKRYHRMIASLRVLLLFFLLSSLTAAKLHADVALANGAPFNDSLTASVSKAGWKYYYIDVPSGSSSLVVDLNNMTADVDLYIRYNAQPTLTSWDCRPYIGGTSEKCTFSSPAAGRWWVGVNNYATGTISYTVKATSSAQASTDTTVPSVPSGLVASAASSSQINLSWSAATDTGGSGLAGYKIYRSGVQIGTSTTTSYSNTGLSAGTSYCYTVAAYDNAGNTSAQGTQACRTTSATTDTTVPSVPSGLVASAASSSQINLSWSAATDTGGSGLAGYKIYRNGVQIGTSPTTSYSNTGLSAGTSYCYKVAAYDNAGNTSAQGTQACATPQASVDTTVPSVSLTDPLAGSIVSGTITPDATASDNVGIAKVEFYRDGTVLLGTAMSA